ncbi:hypothetical protein RhiirC2_796970, partial [Rhizophagus irregularis]
LTSCDHDFTKLSVTPSISLFCEIPKDISESFYQGQVFVSYKDSVFQPSSAFRHSSEWLKCLHEKYVTLPEMLIIYTDGAAVRTAPYHSWTNPAERVMSIINLGLQNVALKRSDMSLDSEIIFKSLGTIEDIRNASSFNQTLTALEEINGLFEILGEKIDNTVTQNGTSQNKLRICVDLQKFIKSHCLIREYSFQIKKCGESDCLICDPVRLPHEIFNQLHYIPDPQISSNPDHYQDFDSLYGQNTTEKDIPSKKNHHECKELAPSGILVAARVRDFVFCISCSKLRCLFSQYVLDDSDYEALQTAMETFAYTCSSPIVPENHFLYDKIFIRMNLTCNLPIEQK